MRKSSEKEISDRIIREFARELRSQLGDRIKKIILYGSRARGDFWEVSDFDVIALVDKRTKEVEDKILDIEGKILDQYSVLICSIACSTRDWTKQKEYPFFRVVEREGIVL